MAHCLHQDTHNLCRLLGSFGYTQVYNLEGGWQAWAGQHESFYATSLTEQRL